MTRESLFRGVEILGYPGFLIATVHDSSQGAITYKQCYFRFKKELKTSPFPLFMDIWGYCLDS